MKRFFVVGLLAIVSLFTNFTSLRAEVEETNSVPTLQLCFTGVPDAVFQIYLPVAATVNLSDGPTSVLAENYLNIGGALFRFSVTSSSEQPVNKVTVMVGGFRQEVEIDNSYGVQTHDVLIPISGTTGTLLVYISASSN